MRASAAELLGRIAGERAACFECCLFEPVEIPLGGSDARMPDHQAEGVAWDTREAHVGAEAVACIVRAHEVEAGHRERALRAPMDRPLVERSPSLCSRREEEAMRDAGTREMRVEEAPERRNDRHNSLASRGLRSRAYAGIRVIARHHLNRGEADTLGCKRLDLPEAQAGVPGEPVDETQLVVGKGVDALREIRERHRQPKGAKLMHPTHPGESKATARRVDPKYASLLVPAIMAIAISLVVSLVQTIVRLGFAPTPACPLPNTVQPMLNMSISVAAL
jgi:hypothetical protein